MKINIYKFWYKYNHLIITAILTTISCFLGYGLESSLIIGGFWLGREHSQAEYRFMKLQKITRDDFGFLQGFNPIAWNFDSLFNDLILPILTGILILLLFML